jgi:hypothetical protein
MPKSAYQRNPERARTYAREYYQAHKNEEVFVQARKRISASLNEKLSALKALATAGDPLAQEQLAAHRQKDKLRKRAQRAVKMTSSL